MSGSSPIVQNATTSVPITNVQPPPEGLMAASVEIVLTPGNSSYTNTFQLSSQSGLMLSQVVTLCIDNSANAYPLAVVHGALNEQCQVAALSVVIVPTFSGRAGGYPVSVTALENVTPTVDLTIDLIFLNHPRQPGTFSATNQQTIIATGQNTSPLVSSIFPLSAGSSSTTLLPAGNYVLDSLDVACEFVLVNATGLAYTSYEIYSGLSAVQTGQVTSTNATTGYLPGPGLNAPAYRTWPQGLILPRGTPLTLAGFGFANTTQIMFRVNISGVSTP